MFASFQKKYFLSDKGVAGVKRGIFWTTLTNLITMAGMGFLFLVMAGFVEHLVSGAALPDALPIVGGLLVFFVLLFASNWQQYYYTYCIFYEECGKQRMVIAERQRISIARALLKDAPIVLLDEATASLDVENETVVQQALSRLLAGKTVIVIAHRMRTVENADKIVVLKDGVVAEQGTPAQLKAAGGEFARMVALQKEAAAWQL